MANEIHVTTTAGLNLYARIRNGTGQVWNTTGTPAFEAWDGGNVAEYAVAIPDKGGGHYVGHFPSTILAGRYWMDIFIQSGSSPSVTDRLRGTGRIVWNGTDGEMFIIDTSGRVDVGAMGGALEGAMDFEEAFRIMFSVLAGKSTGGGTVTLKFRDLADGKDRVIATVNENGNRIVMVLDGT